MRSFFLFLNEFSLWVWFSNESSLCKEKLMVSDRVKILYGQKILLSKRIDFRTSDCSFSSQSKNRPFICIVNVGSNLVIIDRAI